MRSRSQCKLHTRNVADVKGQRRMSSALMSTLIGPRPGPGHHRRCTAPHHGPVTMKIDHGTDIPLALAMRLDDEVRGLREGDRMPAERSHACVRCARWGLLLVVVTLLEGACAGRV